MKEPKPFRKCKMCKEMVPKENFWKDKSQWDGLENRCKPCSRHRTKYKRRLAQKMKIIDYLGGKCVKCGVTPDEIHHTAFDCNHINPEEKTISISKIRGMLWEKVKPEVDKCELLCANCHREVTWRQRQ